MIVDGLIIAFVGMAAWRGWRKGLLQSLVGFIGFVVAIVAAVFGYKIIAKPLHGMKLSHGVSNIVAGVLIFVLVSMGFFLAGRVLTKTLRLTKWGRLNDAGGATLAGAWALAWVTIVLLSISVIPAPKPIASAVKGSAVASGIVRDAPGFARTMARTDLRAMLSLFQNRAPTIRIEPTTDYQAVPAEERLLMYLVGKERAKRGLPALRFDPALAKVARRHVSDMYRRGYFSHQTPEGLSPAGRLRRARITFVRTGENLALANSLLMGHDELMASAVHRRNILSRRFTRMGVGVVFGPQGLLIAQEFAA